MAFAKWSVKVAVAASGTMVRVSILGRADPGDPPALAGLLAGTFAGACVPTAGLLAFEPACPGLLEGPAGELLP